MQSNLIGFSKKTINLSYNTRETLLVHAVCHLLSLSTVALARRPVSSPTSYLA